MSNAPLKILVIGATGSIGRLVVDEALRQGHQVKALVRSLQGARQLPAKAERLVGDVTQVGTLNAALNGIGAIVFTHGADGLGKTGSEQVSYGGVRNVLAALQGRQARVALMTAIGVTNRAGTWNRSTESADWKRRSERLLRASGLPYTIVRPGWFDHNAPDQHKLVMLQGDTHHAGDPSDGVVARQQIAEVLIYSLTSEAANGKTFELVAEGGPASRNFNELFAQLRSDIAGELDAVLDRQDMPLDKEPERVREDLRHVSALKLRG